MQQPNRKANSHRSDEVPVRHMKFDFDPSTMAKYCWQDNAFSSAYILAFSTLIPHGEHLVIDAVSSRRHEIHDPVLTARVQGLIGQESWHSRVHKEFNAAYRAKGMPIDEVDRLGHWFFREFLPSKLTPDMLLAVTCAIEHFTALVAEEDLSKPGHMEKVDPPARAFLLWHLMEECEHKSVAFDVYSAVCGDELIRRAAAVFIITTVAPVFLYATHILLSTPGFSQGRRASLKGLRYWLGGRGYYAGLLPGALRYLRSDFHPDQIDTDALLHEWRERLFGPEGELTANVLKTVMPSSRAAARNQRMTG